AESELVATAGQPFVLRAESPPSTVGGGRVLQAVAQPIGRRQRSRIDRLRMLASPRELDRIETAVYFYGMAPYSELSLVRDSQATASTVKSRLDELCKQGRLLALGVNGKSIRLVHR